MAYFPLSIPGSDIPDNPSFKIAFIIVTVLYAVSIIVLLRLYNNAIKKIPKKPEKDKSSSKEKNSAKSIRSKQCNRRRH